MSKLADQFRAIGIYNNWGMIERFGLPDDVAIEYRRPADGRLGWTETHRTVVWRPGVHPKLAAPRRGIGDRSVEKEFFGLRRESFYTARNWAMEEFGHDYVPSPFGGHIPKHLLSKARAALVNGQ
jgi:hypothetical protein